MSEILNAQSQNTMLPRKGRVVRGNVDQVSIGSGGQSSRSTGTVTKSGGYVSWGEARSPDIYVVPSPKCFIAAANGSASTIALTALELSLIPPSYTAKGRTSAAITASRLNLTMKIGRPAHDTDNSAQFRFIILLCVNGYNNTPAEIFTNSTVWGTPINPGIMASGNYVVLADQIVEMECVPGQYAPTATKTQMLDNNRFISVSRDLQNIPMMFLNSSSTTRPMKNAIMMFYQTSTNIAAPLTPFSYTSHLHFYDC